MSCRRDSPVIELPPTNSWMVTGDNPYFIWDGDSQSFVFLSLSNAGRGSDGSWRSEDLGKYVVVAVANFRCLGAV